MATRYASVSGNWSAVGTWNGGAALPASGDTVVANGVTVTIDQDATVVQVQTLGIGSGATVNFTAVAGIITAVNATPPAGGTLYPVSSTFQLAVTGGGGTGGRVTATTNASGVITSYSTTPAVGGTGYTTNAAAASSSSGGGFTLNDTRTLTAAVLAGTTTCVTFSAASPATATIAGTVTGSAVTNNVSGLQNSSTGTINVTGNVTTGVAGNTNAPGIANSSTGTVTVTGSVTGGNGSGAHGITNSSTGTVTVTGNATGGSGNSGCGIANSAAGTVTVTGSVSGGATANTNGINNASTGTVTVTGNLQTSGSGIGFAINNASTGTVNVTGNVTGGNAASAGYGITNSSTGTVTVTGNITAGTLTEAVYSITAGTIVVTGTATAVGSVHAFTSSHASAYNKLSGPFVDSVVGATAIYLQRLALARDTVIAATNWKAARAALTVPNYDDYRYMYTAGTNIGNPTAENVRSATTFGPASEFTGTLIVPSPTLVSIGVPTDNTVGSLSPTSPSLLQSTTIATLASQTSFTLTNGSPDNNLYNGQTIIITDASTATQKAVGAVSAYTGSTKTITLSADPAIFTMAVGDAVSIIVGASGGGGTGLTAAETRAALGLASANLDTQLSTIDDFLDTEIAAIKAKTDLIPAAPASTTNITAATGIVLSGVTHTGAVIPTVTTVGTLTTYTGNTPQTGDSFAYLGTNMGALGVNLTAADDAVMTTLGTAGVGLTAVPWNAAWDAEVQSEVQDAIEVNHLDHLLAADYDPASKPGVATALLNELIGDDAGVSQYTANALELAPSGGGGGSTDWTANERTAIRAILGIPAAGTTPDDPTTGILDTIRDATTGIQADADDIQSRLPVALVSGRMDSSVGAMAANTLTASALATDAVTEIQSGLSTYAGGAVASVTGSVGSVTGNVGGSVGSVTAAVTIDATDKNTLVDLVWDEALTGATHNVATSAGKRLRQTTAFQQIDATVNDASASTTTFATTLGSSVDNFYNDSMLVFTDGALAGQVRVIADYVGATKTIVLDEALTSAPANGVALAIVSLHVHPIAQIQAGLATSAALATVQSGTDDIQSRLPSVLVGGRIDASVGAMAANTLTASALSTDAVSEIQSGLATPTNITAATGIVLSSVTHTGAVIPTVSSVTGLTASNLDATVSSRASQAAIDTLDDYVDTEVAAIKAKTDQFVFTVANQVDANALSGGGTGLDAAQTRAALGLASANLDTQLGDLPTNAELATALGTADDATLAAIAAEAVKTAAIKAKTDLIPAAPASTTNITAATGIVLSGVTHTGAVIPTVSAVTGLTASNLDVATSTLATAANLAVVAGYLDTEIAAIKAKTDNLPTDPADQSAVEAAITAATSSLATQVSVNDLPTNAELATALGTADDAVLAAIAALNNPSVSAIVTAVLTTALTESYAADGTPPTLTQAMFLIQQSLHEFALSGTTRTVKKLDGTTTAAVFTLDSSTAPTSTTRSS